MFLAIEPADVYARVGVLQVLVIALFGMVILQIVSKVVIFRRVVELLQRSERLLKMSEAHAAVSDSQKERVERVLSSGVGEVKQVVERVPDRTVEKLRQMGTVDDSGHFPKPPGLPLAWLLAPAMVAAALTFAGAGAYHVGTSEGAAMTSPTAAAAFDKAVGLQRSGQFVAAAAAYREAAAAGYDPALCLFGVAECQFYKKEDAAVLKTCGELMRADPGRARFWRGHVFRRQGREDLARLEWEWSYKEGFAPSGMILAGTPHVRPEAKNG